MREPTAESRCISRLNRATSARTISSRRPSRCSNERGGRPGRNLSRRTKPVRARLCARDGGEHQRASRRQRGRRLSDHADGCLPRLSRSRAACTRRRRWTASRRRSREQDDRAPYAHLCRRTPLRRGDLVRDPYARDPLRRADARIERDGAVAADHRVFRDEGRARARHCLPSAGRRGGRRGRFADDRALRRSRHADPRGDARTPRSERLARHAIGGDGAPRGTRGDRAACVHRSRATACAHRRADRRAAHDVRRSLVIGHAAQPMTTIRWGMIGCGDVAEVKSGPGFYKARDSTLAAVMRRDRARAADFARRHGVPRFHDDADAIIDADDIDAVYIATMTDSHHDYTLRCAAAGKAVYVEKPMALELAQAVEMVDACKARGVPLWVAYYRRALPRFVAVREMIADGAIGDVRMVSLRQLQAAPAPEALESHALAWRDDGARGGGLFFEGVGHTLDILDFLLGPIADVQAFADNQARAYTMEDVVVAGFRFASGVYGSGTWCY